MLDLFIAGSQVEEAREQVLEEPLEVLSLSGSGDFVLEAYEAQRIQQVTVLCDDGQYNLTVIFNCPPFVVIRISEKK